MLQLVLCGVGTLNVFLAMVMLATQLSRSNQKAFIVSSRHIVYTIKIENWDKPLHLVKLCCKIVHIYTLVSIMQLIYLWHFDFYALVVTGSYQKHFPCTLSSLNFTQ